MSVFVFVISPRRVYVQSVDDQAAKQPTLFHFEIFFILEQRVVFRVPVSLTPSYPFLLRRTSHHQWLLHLTELS